MNNSNIIEISSPLKQDFIIELLNNKTFNDISYKHLSTSGIKMSFTFENATRNEAVKTAKEAIKNTEIGYVLYFQVV